MVRKIHTMHSDPSAVHLQLWSFFSFQHAREYVFFIIQHSGSRYAISHAQIVRSFLSLVLPARILQVKLSMAIEKFHEEKKRENTNIRSFIESTRQTPR